MSDSARNSDARHSHCWDTYDEGGELVAYSGESSDGSPRGNFGDGEVPQRRMSVSDYYRNRNERAASRERAVQEEGTAGAVDAQQPGGSPEVAVNPHSTAQVTGAAQAMLPVGSSRTATNPNLSVRAAGAAACLQPGGSSASATNPLTTTSHEANVISDFSPNGPERISPRVLDSYLSKVDRTLAAEGIFERCECLTPLEWRELQSQKSQTRRRGALSGKDKRQGIRKELSAIPVIVRSGHPEDILVY